jgi:hypothetical protein
MGTSAASRSVSCWRWAAATSQAASGFFDERTRAGPGGRTRRRPARVAGRGRPTLRGGHGCVAHLVPAPAGLGRGEPAWMGRMHCAARGAGHTRGGAALGQTEASTCRPSGESRPEATPIGFSRGLIEPDRRGSKASRLDRAQPPEARIDSPCLRGAGHCSRCYGWEVAGPSGA